ncbi:MAG TPA: hypothetical protein ENJ82_10540, partial [Bacteroidetes bacterium]|nr:hypothetical protein [Bacteroidota bacterium]
MKSIKTIVFPFLFLLTFNSVFGQLNTVSSGRISISVLNVLGGLQLHSISDNGTELLDTTRNEKLFKLTFRNTLTSLVDSLTAESNWGSATVTNNGNNMLVEFSNPGNG